MSHDAKTYLEIHKTLSEELRHTANVVWQFSIAIVTLQGGAIALCKEDGFRTPMGITVLVSAFILSGLFSLMLYRQAHERVGFRDRIHAVEAALRQDYPAVFVRIPTRMRWFTSIVLAYLLMVESAVGLLLFILYLVHEHPGA